MHTQVHQAADKCCDVVRSRARRPGREVQRVNIDPLLDTESAKELHLPPPAPVDLVHESGGQLCGSLALAGSRRTESPA